MIYSNAYGTVPPEECAAILAVHAEGIETYRTGAPVTDAASDYGERLRYAVKRDGEDLFCHCCDENLRPGQRYAVILVNQGNCAFWVRVCAPCGKEARAAILEEAGKT